MSGRLEIGLMGVIMYASPSKGTANEPLKLGFVLAWTCDFSNTHQEETAMNTLNGDRTEETNSPVVPARDLDELPALDLKALLQSSREAIARAATEVLEEREAGSIFATKHANHSSHRSSSTW
jgi:hypothetical protein